LAQIDRRAWEERQKHDGKLAEREKNVAATLARLRQVAVPLERLTGSEHWDTFLRMGESLQVADMAARAEAQERLASPGWLAPAEVAGLRHSVAVLTASIRARHELMTLPISILSDIQKLQ